MAGIGFDRARQACPCRLLLLRATIALGKREAEHSVEHFWGVEPDGMERDAK